MNVAVTAIVSLVPTGTSPKSRVRFTTFEEKVIVAAVAGESWPPDSSAAAASMESERNPQARMVRLPKRVEANPPATSLLRGNLQQNSYNPAAFCG
jgi:hypothetical protein